MHGGAYFRNFTVTCGVTFLSHEKPALRGQYCSPKGCCLTVDQQFLSKGNMLALEICLPEETAVISRRRHWIPAK